MNNLQGTTQRAITTIKRLINKPKITPTDTNAIKIALDENPLLLNNLSMEEISKISVLGIDLSRYISEIHINNIRSFVVLYASESMMRVSKLMKILDRAEEQYYDKLFKTTYLHPKIAEGMINQIQDSIAASVNLMLKLTDNETLMNLFVVNLNGINAEISANRQIDGLTTREIIPLSSRKKIDRMLVLVRSALEEGTELDPEPEIEPVDAEYKET